MRPPFLFGLIAFLVPLTSHAQDAASSPYRPFYAGIGANLGTYWLKWGGGYIREPFSFSPALALGMMVKPNLALQVRVTAYEQRRSSNYSYPDLSPGPNYGQVRYVATAYRNQILVVPILLRYTLTQNAMRRLQADALLGFNTIHTRERSSGSTSDSTHTVISSSSDSYAARSTSLTVGAGLRYALTPRVEFATELLNNIHFIPYGMMKNYNAQMELRYRFGPLEGN